MAMQYRMSNLEFLAVQVKTIKAVWAAPLSVSLMWLNTFFGEAIFLLVTEIEIGVKILTGVFTLVIGTLGYFASKRQKKAEENKHNLEIKNMREDQYKENVNWLRENDFISKDASKEEIALELEKHFSEFN